MFKKQGEQLTLQELEALKDLRFYRNLYRGSTSEALQWRMPETKHGTDLSDYERLVQLGYAEESHMSLDEMRPKGTLSRIFFNLTQAAFFPSGICHRYKITEAGMNRANFNTFGW